MIEICRVKEARKIFLELGKENSSRKITEVGNKEGIYGELTLHFGRLIRQGLENELRNKDFNFWHWGNIGSFWVGSYMMKSLF